MAVAVLLARVLDEHRHARAAVGLAKVMVFERLGVGQALVDLGRDEPPSGTISRYSPWNATSNSPWATIT